MDAVLEGLRKRGSSLGFGTKLMCEFARLVLNIFLLVCIYISDQSDFEIKLGFICSFLCSLFVFVHLKFVFI